MELNRLGSDSDDDNIRTRNSELFSAIAKGKFHKVRALLESGIKTDITDKNNKNNTPLHYAVEKDKKDIVAELLHPKWKTNLNRKNAQGRTPLTIARQRDYKDIIELLQNHGVEVSDESAFLKSTLDKNEIGNQKNYLKLNFQKTKGAAGIEGQMCEINLTIFLLLKGKSANPLTEFYLASNFEKADKFDDIVFKYTSRGKPQTIFLQSKHKMGDQEETMKITRLNNLLSDSESGDFSLNKYFLSYRKIKQQFLSNENPDDPVFSGNFNDCEFLIYTNAPFENCNNSCIKEIAMDDNNLFKNSQGKIFQLVFHSDERKRIFDIFKNSSDCRRLAKALAEAFASKNGLDIQKEIFQTYHKALQEKVIQKTEDSNGKLREDFFCGVDNQFKTVFFEEAAKVSKKSMGDISQELLTKEIKLSKKFWHENCNGSSELPNDDPIGENEVEDFLTKFKLYASQPNEKALESAIKKTAKEFYKIEQQDIGIVFAGVENKVKKWWQDENFYLMKDNKFFEDALRVSVEFDVIEPVASFTGRTQVLVDLHKMLQKGGAVSISQTATITGLGGIGKSETARKYLCEYKKHYDNNVIWINAENHSTITQSFQKLAQDKLKMNTIDENGKEKDIQVLAKEVYNFFAKMNRKCIFVFDNAEKKGPEDEHVDKLLPSGLSKPYVIITTRHQEWDGIHNLPLGLFSQEEAEAFIKNATEGKKIEIEDNELQELIKELDFLPLALRQAVAYISVENEKSKKWSNKQFTISCYLEQFRKNANLVLGLGTIRNHKETVKTTWKTSIEKIKLKSELALEILQVIAYLAPDHIPVEEIVAAENRDQQEIRSAIELLDQYSMVRIEGGMVDIHRLVQKVTRIEMEESKLDEKTLLHTFTLLIDCYPYKSEKMEDISKKRRMLQHFEVLVSHFEKLLQKKPEERAKLEQKHLRVLFCYMANGYGFNPYRKKELLELALSIEKNYFEPDHFEVAITLTNLSNAYGSLGDAQKQKELLEDALLIQENHYGPDNFKMTRTLANLGNAYGALGDAKKKKELVERALLIQENYFGLDHFEVGITLTNLSNSYAALGDAQKQKQLLERALPIFEHHYGPDHFNVAITLGNLGNAYGALGDVQKKKQLLERALTIDENYYGPDHYAVAKTLTNLSNAYGDLGDAQKQKQLLERALPICENHYGPDHFEVAIILGSLGNAYGALGDAQKQKKLQEHALAIEVNYYGLDHFTVAGTLAKLGNAYGALGDPQKKKKALERALAIQENYFGSDHSEVAITLANLATAYEGLGDVQKQKQLLERALTIFENHYGPYHFYVAAVLGNLGNAYGALGNPQKQKQLLERALTIKENHYGPDHFEVAKILGNLGNAYGALGDAQKQKYHLEHALTMTESYYGPDHPEVARTLTNLSNAYRALGDPQKQKQLLERALPIFENYYGPDNFTVAKTLTNLADAYGGLGDNHTKTQLLERALTIKENHYGPDHSEVAFTLTKLSNAYRALGVPQKQKQVLERAQPIFESHYGPDHPEVAIILTSLGSAYGALGDVQKCKQALERALLIQENHYGPDHHQVVRTRSLLRVALRAFGNGDAGKRKMSLNCALICMSFIFIFIFIKVAKDR